MQYRQDVQSNAFCRAMLLYNFIHLSAELKQAVRLGGRHNMPPPHLDVWPFDLEVDVGVACDLGYPCAKFRLPRPFGFRVRADVRDIRRTDGRTDGRTDADDRLMPPPYGAGHNKIQTFTNTDDNKAHTEHKHARTLCEVQRNVDKQRMQSLHVQR